MAMAALQEDEIGQLQELSCPYLAKLHPALLATKLVQERPRAFGSKTVVLHGQSQASLCMHQPLLRHDYGAEQAKPHVCYMTPYKVLEASSRLLSVPCSLPWYGTAHGLLPGH